MIRTVLRSLLEGEDDQVEPLQDKATHGAHEALDDALLAVVAGDLIGLGYFERLYRPWAAMLAGHAQ